MNLSRRKLTRFIPAFAGNAAFTAIIYDHGTVHPRVCGERSDQDRCMLMCYGSSPRLRGTLSAERHRRRSSRFIPAFAGNAFRQSRWRRTHSVHPRVCGERSTAMTARNGCCGSSPRLRGTQAEANDVANLRRFIPAFAGNAPLPRSPGSARPVHPRVCGERTCWNSLLFRLFSAR